MLVCDPEPLSLGALQEVLRQLGFEHRVITPAEFPESSEALAACDAIVLSDWREPDLTERQVELLEQYVNRGGGLIFVGGARVSTINWHGCPLEQLLPIDFAPQPVREKQRLKPVHVCYVLDVSGSMAQVLGVDQSGPVTKFAMTKAAVAASLEALPETAVVTVIVFDIHHQVVLEAVPIEQRETIRQRVAALGVGGGTNMVPAMVEAVQILNRTDIPKHMIVLTDGISSEDPPEELLDWITAANISLTAVAVGADSNTALMEHMARETQGVYHYCGDATRIPRVFVREAEHIKTLAAIERAPILPRLGPQRDLLRGIAPDGWPPLEAAVPAKAKPSPGVEIALVSERDEPLLARWQVGLGSVTAFMSDVKPTWARRWMQWPEFERFWAKILSSALPGSSTLEAAMDVRTERDTCVVLLSVFDTEGRLPVEVMPTGQLSMEGDSAQSTIPLRWQRLPSGVFEGRATVQPGSRYVGSIAVRGDDGSIALSRRFIVTGPGKLELLASGPDTRTLRALAAAGNGRYAPSREQLRAAVGEERSRTITVVKPYWRLLLMLALALWPVDIACRRLGT
jgi:Ca-activated chloride channel family protein